MLKVSGTDTPAEISTMHAGVLQGRGGDTPADYWLLVLVLV